MPFSQYPISIAIFHPPEIVFHPILTLLHYQCFSRAFSPAFSSSLFAFSVSFAFLPLRYTWVLVMMSLAILGTKIGRRIVEEKTSPPRRP